MDGEKKVAAAKNMINGLHDLSYIDEREKTELEYRLKTGDLKVFEELRAYLIKLADNIAK